ncbi:topoisomerase DNA-binding C4 zinc finger domain-containing protein, partial [Candidatus Micrarchaeota archaeon]|nr:topoisomerase DNA-binding C4 zinc finger domain-containing protein [Candidatus Micrarchaeota archaeon]MBU1930224.1 topoisomerase DNA-binding C4 zinc finger domain-containing protein [Candidatus Micrarchaeota archaeon]
FKPLSKIAPGDKIVSLHDNACSTVQGSIEWQSFIKKCDKNTYLFAHGLSAKLKRTRLNFNKSQRAFAHWLGCSQGNYSSYESDKRPIPLCLLKKINLVPKKISSQNEKALVSNPFPLKITAPLARILAKLIGDGSLDREKVKRENCFDFRYTNTNPDLIEEFVQDVEKVFKTRSRIYYRPENEKVSVKVPVVMGRMPAVVGRIVSILFPDVLNKLPWKKLPNALFPDFVGAFFDDEGHVTKKESKLFLSNTNHQTLRVLQKMLKTLNIESSLDTKQHKLHVRRRQSLFNFLEKIPVTSVKKKQRLMDIISTHYKYGAKNRPLFVFEKQLLAVLKEPKTTAELAGIFGVSKSSIVSRIRKLRKERKVKKLVDGNNKDVPRTIQYGSLVDLSNSGYSILEEQAIKPKLVTKTVKRIENIPLPPAVYDITNSLEHPAFVLANNVIAHNSTRHEIIQKLYYRQYISGLKSIEPNEIAFAVISSLEKHCKTVTEPKMTAELEAEMDEIAVGKKPKDSVVLESRNVLLKVLEQLLKDKNEIATELRQGLRQDSIVGKCTDASCEGELIIRHGKTGKRFLGCTKYPKCTVTYPLPQKGKLIVLNKECETCQAPMIRLINQRSAFAMCINHNCATKEEWKKRAAEKKAKALQKPATKKAPKKTATTKAKTTRKKKKN